MIFLLLVKMLPCLQEAALICWRLLFGWCLELALISQQRAYRKSLCKIFCTNEVDINICLKANLNKLKCDDLQCRHSIFPNLPLRFSVITGAEPPVILLLVTCESCTWSFSFHTRFVEEEALILLTLIEFVKRKKNPFKSFYDQCPHSFSGDQ